MRFNFSKVFSLLMIFFLFTCITINPKSETRIVQLCGSGDFLITEKRILEPQTKPFILKEQINQYNKELSALEISTQFDDKKKIKSLHEKIDSIHIEIISLLHQEGDTYFNNKSYSKAIESYLDTLYEYSLLVTFDSKMKIEQEKIKKKIRESHELGETEIYNFIESNLSKLQKENKLNDSSAGSIRLKMKNSPFLSPKIIAYYNSKAYTYKLKEYSDTITCSNSKSVDLVESESIRTKLTGSSIFRNSIGMEFIFIPSGEFIMGCSVGDNECSNSEKPPHKITISNPFYIGRYEVTYSDWMNVMNSKPKNYKDCRGLIDSFFDSKVNCPIINISYNESQDFIKKLCEKEKSDICKYRLPTEAEWEYSARAGKTTKFYWGKELNDEYTSLDMFGTPVTVGQKKPNDFGLYDISGNAWEWVSDFYDEDYYSKSPAKDPKGPLKGEYKVLRGGSRNVYGMNNRTSYRYFFSPDASHTDFGFRLLRTLD